ncbi:MAG: MlaD family protein [Verrucomicrobiota bacterium]
MAVQDLTPQLRTRLSRVERAVGWFVLIATLLLVAGFAYYLYHTAKRKGWFLTKVRYFTMVDTAAGLKVGQPVRLMGFDIGEITRIDAQPPEDQYYNVYVEFSVKSPYYGYLWTKGSKAKVAPADFLGSRIIEVTKGTNGVPSYLFFEELTPSQALLRPDMKGKVFLDEILRPGTTNLLVNPLDWVTPPALESLVRAGIEKIRVADKAVKSRESGKPTVWDDKLGKYIDVMEETPPYFLVSAESAAVTERLEEVADMVQEALPKFLTLTNQLTQALTNAVYLTGNANDLLIKTQPIISNVAQITALLTNQHGSLGDWLIPTNLHTQLQQTVTTANSALTRADSLLHTVDTNMLTLISNINLTLENLANITSNLNTQVQTNDQILSQISRAVTNADHLLQGLKRHWLLRSAFKEKPTNAPPRRTPPKAGKQH